MSTVLSVNLSQSHYRIVVQVVNENDNRPNFLPETIQPFTISEVKHGPLQVPNQKTERQRENWENQDQYTINLSSVVTQFYPTQLQGNEPSQSFNTSVLLSGSLHRGKVQV